MTMAPPPGATPDPNIPHWSDGRATANTGETGAPDAPAYPVHVAPPPQIWVDGRWITPPPPGSVPPAYLLSQVRAIGTAVTILLGLTLVAAVAMLIADISWLNFLQRASDGYFLSVTEADVEQAGAFVQSATVIWMATYLATGVVFVIWFYRIRKNAGVWAPQRQRRSQGWSIGGWLCPIVNFWFPYQIAVDALESARTEGSGDRSGRAILRWWWGLWATSVVLSLAVRGSSGSLDTLADVVSLAQLDISFDILHVAAGVPAILAVRVITATQSRRIDASYR